MVRSRALAAGGSAWLDALPALLADLERDWELVIGRALEGGSEAYVAEATLADGTSAVLKLATPRDDRSVEHEITALRLADGRGCARLLRDDLDRGAMLLERLGAPLHDRGLAVAARDEILCTVAALVWRPAPDCGLPSGAEKGRWLIEFIARTWAELGRPCVERAVAYALACAERRVAAHDDERAVLVHGDVHDRNALASGDSYKLVDPDGLLAEAEYDLGVLIREDLLTPGTGDPRARAARLAAHTGRDADAIWEWAVVERLSTGLLCTSLGLQPTGRELLAAAERAAGDWQQGRR